MLRLTLIVIAIVVGSVGRAETLVHWGGDYVTGSRNFNLPTPVDNSGTRTYPYSSTTALSPTTGYVPPTGRSGNFFGTLENISDDGTPENFGAARVSNDVLLGDSFYVQQKSGVPGMVRGMFFFPKSGFLAGGAGPIGLDGVSGSLNINVLADSGSFRFAVQNGSQWYVSQSQRTAIGLFELADFAGESWGAWNPATTPIDLLPATFTTGGATLTDIQAFGFTFTATRHSSAQIGVREFRIEAVPEPTGVLLAAVGFVGLGAIRWRRFPGRDTVPQ